MTDYFVAAGSAVGDGTRQSPFHDPWLALREAAPGDSIHIAAGTYTGRLQRSSWVVDCPDLTVLGGYSSDFSTRSPWSTPTVLSATAGLRVPHEPNLLLGTEDHDGLVLDGLFFDGSGRDEYDDQGVLQHASQGDGALVSLRGERITVRGCVFANGSSGGVELSGDGGVFEDNLVVNCVGLSLLIVRDATPEAPITVSRNTFCFAHDDADPPRGSGADRALGVRVYGAATIADNLFVGCGNAAIACLSDVAQIGVERNLFAVTLRDILRSRVSGAEAEITEEYVHELADVGLRSATGNAVGDPQLTGLPSGWLDSYTADVAATYERPPVDALNGLRKAAGLGELPPAADSDVPRPVMRRLAPAEVLALSVGATQGSHPTEPAAPGPFTERPAAPDYQDIDWTRLAQADPSLAGAPVQVRAGLGNDQNTQIIPELAESHIGVAVYEPGTDDSPWWALAPRHGLVHHQTAEAMRYSRGLDVQALTVLRGTYRTDVAAGGRQPVTIVLDSIAPVTDIAAPEEQHPTGRDWFVRTGADGDGTREAPLRDPFQALEKAAEGDRILVAEGEYTGRLRSGAWRIPVRNLTLLGGWDAEFAARDPWRHPVRFVLTPETKAKGIFGIPVLTVEDSAEGLVLDGFVFDGSTYNTYTDAGSLDPAASQSAVLLDLRGGNGGLTVRNCVFANAASGAVQLSAGHGAFENNVVVNTSGTAVRIQVPGPGPWSVQGNTILFAADPTGRASTGQSTSGCLLDMSGQGVIRVTSNVLAFADSIALRATVPGWNLALEGNALAANLYADIFDGRSVLIDAANRDRVFQDAPFGVESGTTFALPAVPVDPTFAKEAVARLSALAAAMPKDSLNAAAAALGVSLAAPAGAEATAASADAPAPTAEPSVADLLADLGQARKAFEAADAPEPAPDVPLFCPVYPFAAALRLALDAPTGVPGARAVPVG
ncbi:right-handed parallel beta-helix repeat-containing protein [Microbacterium sp. NPDC019599]|uniref:right-handed parallel beta-helix repeat-containing protein n=1 Tax=Microbacterium sp. NPDC019599 TaxID=3154690 RepID=UPI0033F46C17